MNKKDFLIVSIVGLLIGFFAQFPLRTLGSKINLSVTPFFVVALVVGCGIFAILALFILKLLGKKIPIFEKFGKFAAIGTLNTVIDIGIVNAFMATTGAEAGWTYVGFKAISFLVATTNSYFWNKLWTFQSRTPVGFSEYFRFGGFTLFGVAVNASVAGLVVNVLPHPTTISLTVWANIGALVAVAVSFLINFFNYNNFVFKKSSETKTIS